MQFQSNVHVANIAWPSLSFHCVASKESATLGRSSARIKVVWLKSDQPDWQLWPCMHCGTYSVKTQATTVVNTNICKPGRNKIPLVWLTGACTQVQKLRGSGGMLPQENFLNLMLGDGFWGYFGAQNITTIFCFSPCMVTGFWSTSRLQVWR